MTKRLMNERMNERMNQAKLPSSLNLWLIRSMPILFVVIWSSGFIIARYGMPYAAPLSFLSLRFAISIIGFGLWLAIGKQGLPPLNAQWLHLVVVGILMHAVYLGGVWIAVKWGMGAGLSSLIVGFQPILTALFVAWKGQSITKRQWLGLAVGLMGLMLVCYVKLGHGEVTIANLTAVTLSLLAITGGTLYQKRFVKPLDFRQAAFIQILAAFVLLWPLSWLESEPTQWMLAGVPNYYLWGSLLWAVFGLTMVASSLLYILINRGLATNVTSMFYLVPPSTAILAWVLFDESITLTTGLGTLLAVCGVFFVVVKPKHS